MTSIAVVDPVTVVLIWLMFVIPIVVFVGGILVYYFKPLHRKINGVALVVTGSVELLTFLLITHAVTMLPLALYSISLLAIIIGIFSLKNQVITKND
jgi:hypothetical protein